MEKLLLKSKQEEIHKIERFAEAISDKYNIGNTYFANILVSLTEAFNNALIHGNKNDLSKMIVLDFEIDNSKMIFSITDEGEGFDYELFINDAIELPGNGIFMIQHAADSLSFEEEGRKIVMSFNVASFNEAISNKRSSVLQEVKNKTSVKLND